MKLHKHIIKDVFVFVGLATKLSVYLGPEGERCMDYKVHQP